jgi:hypothetical protein
MASLFGPTLPTKTEFLQRTAKLKASDLRRLTKIPGFRDLFDVMLNEGEAAASPIDMVVTCHTPRSKLSVKKRNMNAVRFTVDIRYRTKQGKDNGGTNNQESGTSVLSLQVPVNQ